MIHFNPDHFNPETKAVFRLIAAGGCEDYLKEHALLWYIKQWLGVGLDVSQLAGFSHVQLLGTELVA
jgi:hypothetical protein